VDGTILVEGDNWVVASPERGRSYTRAHRWSPAVVEEGDRETVVTFVALLRLNQWRGCSKVELSGGTSSRRRCLGSRK
jgi:hypothetical protein